VRPAFSTANLVSLPNFTIVGRLLADGVPLEPFLFHTAWKPRVLRPDWAEELRAYSNARYATAMCPEVEQPEPADGATRAKDNQGQEAGPALSDDGEDRPDSPPKDDTGL
jgi:hypothetical protein